MPIKLSKQAASFKKTSIFSQKIFFWPRPEFAQTVAQLLSQTPEQQKLTRRGPKYLSMLPKRNLL